MVFRETKIANHYLDEYAIYHLEGQDTKEDPVLQIQLEESNGSTQLSLKEKIREHYANNTESFEILYKAIDLPGKTGDSSWELLTILGWNKI